MSVIGDPDLVRRIMVLLPKLITGAHLVSAAANTLEPLRLRLRLVNS